MRTKSRNVQLSVRMAHPTYARTLVIENHMTTHSPVIVALDFASAREAEVLADALDPRQCRLKIGKELFTHCGPDIVRRMTDRGYDIFLDLKFHDIPNTVAGAVRAAAELGVWMLNVHAAGGPRMMEAAREALQPWGAQAPLLTAVTVLTSMTREELLAVGIQGEPLVQVTRLAALAEACGLDGVVCAAREVIPLRTALPRAFRLVTPGIRPGGSDPGDQRRTATPAEALQAGSDYLVIGRPITRAPDPLAALREINRELEGGSPTP